LGQFVLDTHKFENLHHYFILIFDPNKEQCELLGPERRAE